MAKSTTSGPHRDQSQRTDSDAEAREKVERLLAIALKYDPETGSAPKITATGRGKVAEQILDIAFAQGVKVRQDADLAEVLSILEVDSVIPIEVLATVAEILAYVYRANGAEPPSITMPAD